MKDFFIGVIFVLLITEVWTWFSSLGNNLFEYLCTKIAVKTYLLKSEIENDNEEYEEKQPAIGFFSNPAPLEPDDFDEDDDDEEEESEEEEDDDY